MKPGPHLTEVDVVAIRDERAKGATVADIGRRFGVTPAKVSLITTGALRKRAGGPLLTAFGYATPLRPATEILLYEVQLASRANGTRFDVVQFARNHSASIESIRATMRRTNRLFDRLFTSFRVDENGCYIWTALLNAYGEPRFVYHEKGPDGRYHQYGWSPRQVLYRFFKGVSAGYPLKAGPNCTSNLCVNPFHAVPARSRRKVAA